MNKRKIMFVAIPIAIVASVGALFANSLSWEALSDAKQFYQMKVLVKERDSMNEKIKTIEKDLNIGKVETTGSVSK